MSELARLRAGGLEVIFEQRGDRIVHFVHAGARGETQSLLRSRDEIEALPWPVSPPLQQIHLEERPAGVQVALLVGMAGSSHWSLACTAHPAAELLAFDVAVRVKQPPARLGSRYDLASGATFDEATMTIDRCCVIRCAVSTRLDLADGIVFGPETIPETLPATVQWRYELTSVATAE